MDHSVLPNARLLVNEGNSREWAETLKEMQNRSRYSSHNLLLSLPKDDDDTDNFSPLQSQPSIRKVSTLKNIVSVYFGIICHDNVSTPSCLIYTPGILIFYINMLSISRLINLKSITNKLIKVLI